MKGIKRGAAPVIRYDQADTVLGGNRVIYSEIDSIVIYSGSTKVARAATGLTTGLLGQSSDVDEGCARSARTSAPRDYPTPPPPHRAVRLRCGVGGVLASNKHHLISAELPNWSNFTSSHSKVAPLRVLYNVEYYLSAT